jgi:hypothetical protein
MTKIYSLQNLCFQLLDQNLCSDALLVDENRFILGGDKEENKLLRRH